MSRHRSCFSVNGHIFSLLLVLSVAFIIFSLLAPSAQAGQAILAWDPNTNSGLVGYKVYVGNASRSYQSSLNVGNQTTATIANLQEGATYYFAVTAYDTSSEESGYSNEVTYTVQAACTYSASPASQSFTSAGGTGSVSITTAAGCAWTAVSNASWITITSNVNVTGSGTTYYSVSANTSTSSRTGTMTIAGKTVTVSQAGAASQYNLTLTKAGTGNGTLSNSPTGSTFAAGTAVTITASPDANSTFAGWSGSCTGTSTTCTLTMNANAAVTATFNSKSYTIAATAGANGTISPSGSVAVNSGANQTFTITPSSGYKIADVKVDGTSVGTVASFLFGAVLSNHTIDATFTSSASQPGSVVAAVNSGGSSYAGKSGIQYGSDKYYQGGSIGKAFASIAGTYEDTLYKTERYGNFSYSAPIANGTYFVTLKFAETFWFSSNRRIFNVKIQGQQVITNLDIFAKAGRNRAYDVTLPVTVSNGVMQIEFVSVKDNAKINAIVLQKAQ